MVVAEIPVMKLRPSGGQRGLGSAELEARSALTTFMGGPSRTLF